MNTPTKQRMRFRVCIPSEAVLAFFLVASPLLGQDAPRPRSTELVKPQWQRVLQGADIAKAAELVKKISRFEEAGSFAEAIAPAAELASLRERVQGKGHWQTEDARRLSKDLADWAKLPLDKRLELGQIQSLLRRKESLYQKGEYQKAGEVTIHMLDICRKILGEQHANTAAAYANLAVVFDAQGQSLEAADAYQKALAINLKVLGSEHPETATVYANMAFNQLARGKHVDAEAGFRKALATRLKLLGENHLATANAFSGVGMVLQTKAKYGQAEKWHEKALAISRRVLGEKDLETATCYEYLAECMSAQRRFDEAEVRHRKALEIRLERLGEEHPQTATSLSNLAAVQNQQGKYAEAEKGIRKALAIRLKILGDEHPDTAHSYNNGAANFHDQGKYAEATEWYQKALAIVRKRLGEEHPTTAVCYNNVAFSLNSQGKFAEAEPRIQKALEINRKIYGDEHPATASSYNGLAVNLKSQGRYSEAEVNIQKAIEIARKSFGEGHPNIAVMYNTAASNLKAQAKFDAAELLFQKALAIRRNAFGDNNISTARSYNNLASNLNAQGKYIRASQAFSEALKIFRRLLGEEHPVTASVYNNLASNFHDQGRYAEAEVGYLKALAIRLKVLGLEHPDTATSFNNLAFRLNDQTRYVEAEEGLRFALSIYRKVLGEDHPITAECYNNVAHNLHAQGKHDAAMKLYQKALEITRKINGEGHPRTARIINNMAFVLKSKGEYAEAAGLFEKALSIFRTAHGIDHPDTAASYNNIAFNLNAQGQFTKAAEGFEKGRDLRIKVLGRNHPDTLTSFYNVAANRIAMGNYAESEALLASAVAIRDRLRILSARVGADRAIANSGLEPDAIYAAVLARNEKAAQATNVLENSLGRGLLDDLAGRQRTIPKKDQRLRVQLIGRVNSIDELIKSQRAKMGPESGKIIERLLQSQLDAKSELATLVRDLEKDYGVAVGKVLPMKRIQEAIPKDSALVAWVDLEANPKAADPNGDHWAFFLRATGDPVVVKVPGSGVGGAWTQGDYEAPAKLRRMLRNSRVPIPQEMLAAFRSNRFGVLRPHLRGADDLPPIRRLVVLPSSYVAGLPVELFTPEGIEVSYSPSGSLFTYLRELPNVKSSGVFAVGDPLFKDATSEKRKEKPLPASGVLVTTVMPNSNAAKNGLMSGDVLLSYDGRALSKSTDLKTRNGGKVAPVEVWREGKQRVLDVAPGRLGIALATKPAREALLAQRELEQWTHAVRAGAESFERLPGAFIEVAQLSSRFDDAEENRTVWVGSNASEAKLANLAANNGLKRFRYLHFATHGEIDHQRPSRSALILSQVGLPDPAAQLEDGLTIFDGRVTVEEIVEQWELDADLVVLSACDTALGRFTNGEGYMGFSQALMLAGARSVMLSLWKVDDAATMLLMDRFYANLLGHREGLKAPMSKAQALAEAKSWLRELPLAEANALVATFNNDLIRGKGRIERPAADPKSTPQTKSFKGGKPFSHPYYWAAFVLIGETN